MMQVGPFELDAFEMGPTDGPVVLLIHGNNPVPQQAAFVHKLAKAHRVIAPSHPGFGASPLPPDFDSPYDLVNLYLSVLDVIPAECINVIVFSFGGWIAAEVAVAGHAKLRRLVLTNAVGIKIGPRDQRDIVHFFNTNPAELERQAWRDPTARPAGCYGLGWQAQINDTIPDADLVTLARNWDTLCLYAWRPHMYNPQLRHWLHRIKTPTRVIWGENDQIVTPDYGRKYASLIPGAQFEMIPKAGHHPEYEQPGHFASAVERFIL